MTTESQGSTTLENGEGEGTKVDSGAELLKLQKLLEQTTAERDKLRVNNRELKATTGGAEDIKKQLDALLAEKSKLVEDFEGFKGKVKLEKLDSHLTTALKDAGAKSLSAALKLLDRSTIEFGDDDSVKVDSVKKAIDSLKEAEPVLFGETESKEPTKPEKQGVPPKPAVQKDDNSKTSYEQELRAAKSIKQIEAIMKKYGVRA